MPAKLLHIIIDGCRPDGLAQANTPHLDSLWGHGAYSWTAQSVMPTISLPCHSSMFRSVLPGKHGIYDNVYAPTAAGLPQHSRSRPRKPDAKRPCSPVGNPCATSPHPAASIPPTTAAIVPVTKMTGTSPK